MMAPELHADDLLDKEARGELSTAEKSRLDRHVEACSVCRFERQVRADFRLEFETLGKADRREATDGRPVAGARANGRMSSRMRLVLLAAAATLVTGAAAAEWENIKRTVFSSYVMNDSRDIHQGDARTEAPLSARGADVTNAAPMAPPTPEQAAIEQPSVVDPPKVDSVVAAAPVAEARKSPTLEPGPRSAQRQPPITAETPAIEPSAELAAPPQAPAPVTADALFASANDERQRGAYADAIRLYRDLSQQFPQSAEATAAHAIVGRLLLDRGDPAGALVQFDEYVQSGKTTLGEEARVGRALALQRLGRSAEEADAWTALLAAYPQSVHAARARSRLAALGNR